MNASFYRKIEIAAWDMIIEYLSNSTAVRSLIKQWLMLKKSHNLGLYTAIIAMGGAFGLFLGLAIPQILFYIQ
jgi:hypothetical protein